MNGDPQKRKVLYEALTKDGYALGTLDEFSSKMDDPNKARALYDGITKDGYQVGDFETFNAKVGSPKPAALPSMTTPLPGAAAGPSSGSGMQQAVSPTPSPTSGVMFDEAGEELADVENLEPPPFEEADRQAYIRSLEGEPDAVAPARVRNAILDRNAASRALSGQPTVTSGTDGVFTRNAALPVGEKDERDEAILLDYAKQLGARNELGFVRGTIERLEEGADSGLDRYAKTQFDAIDHQQRKLEGRAAQVYALIDQGVPPEQLTDEIRDIEAGEEYLTQRRKWMVQNLPKSETQRIIEQRQKEAQEYEKERGIGGTLREGARITGIGFGESILSSAAGLARVTAELTGTSDGYDWSEKFSDFADATTRKQTAYLPPEWNQPLSRILKDAQGKDILDENGNPQEVYNIMPTLLRGAGGMGGLVVGAGAVGRAGSLLGKLTGRAAASAGAVNPLGAAGLTDAAMGAGAQAGRTAGMFFPEFDGQMRRAIEAGADEDAAVLPSAAYALASSIIEEFNPQAYIKVPGLKSQLQKGFVDAIKEGVPADAKALITHVAKKAGNEGLKEALETAAQKGSEIAANRVTNAISGSELEEDVSARDFINEVASAFVLGSAFGTVNQIGQGKKIRKTTAEAIRFAAENPQAVEQMIATQVPPAEQDKFKERLERLSKTYKGNRLSDLPTQQGAQAATVIERKQDVKSDISEAPMDPALRAAKGDPREAEVAALTVQELQAMGVPADEAALILANEGLIELPDGAKVKEGVGGKLTLEVKEPKEGEEGVSKKEVQADLTKQVESILKSAGFSMEEATGAEEEPTAAPAESSVVADPVRSEAAIPPVSDKAIERVLGGRKMIGVSDAERATQTGEFTDKEGRTVYVRRSVQGYPMVEALVKDGNELKVIGRVHLSPKDFDAGYIVPGYGAAKNSIEVSKSERRKGVGSAMMQFASQSFGKPIDYKRIPKSEPVSEEMQSLINSTTNEGSTTTTEAPAAQAPEDTGDPAGVPPAPEPAAEEPVAIAAETTTPKVALEKMDPTARDIAERKDKLGQQKLVKDLTGVQEVLGKVLDLTADIPTVTNGPLDPVAINKKLAKYGASATFGDTQFQLTVRMPNGGSASFNVLALPSILAEVKKVSKPMSEPPIGGPKKRTMGNFDTVDTAKESLAMAESNLENAKREDNKKLIALFQDQYDKVKKLHDQKVAAEEARIEYEKGRVPADFEAKSRYDREGRKLEALQTSYEFDERQKELSKNLTEEDRMDGVYRDKTQFGDKLTAEELAYVNENYFRPEGYDFDENGGLVKTEAPKSEPKPTKKAVATTEDINTKSRDYKGGIQSGLNYEDTPLYRENDAKAERVMADPSKPIRVREHWAGYLEGKKQKEAQAAAQQTSIDQAPAQAEAPLPKTIIINSKKRSTENSNGKFIAATEEGVRNFWKWFGDSKVVDEQGRPLVVYHGGPSAVSDFSIQPETRNKPTSTAMYGSDGRLLFGREKPRKNIGFYFSDNSDAAKWFGSTHDIDGDGNETSRNDAKITEAYLRIENPARERDIDDQKDAYPENDGVIAKEGGATTYVAFSSDQIRVVSPKATTAPNAQAEAPLPKEAEPVTSITEVGRNNTDPKKADEVEYKIPGWENYTTVVRKRNGGWAMYILKDGNDYEIHGPGKEEPTPRLAADSGAERLNRNKEKVEQMVGGGKFEAAARKAAAAPEEVKPETRAERAARNAAAIRAKKRKLDPGSLYDATEVIATKLFNGALEAVAKAIEAGATVAEQIELAIRYLKSSDAWRSLTADDKKRIKDDTEDAIRANARFDKWVDFGVREFAKKKGGLDFPTFKQAFVKNYSSVSNEVSNADLLEVYAEAQKAYDASVKDTEQTKRTVDSVTGVSDKRPTITLTERQFYTQKIRDIASGFKYGFDRAAFSEKAKGRKEGMAEQKRADARAEKERIAAKKEEQKSFVERINEVMKPLDKKLLPSQVKAIVSRAAKVSTPAQARKFTDYVDKVFADAEYAEKEAVARKTAKRIKSKVDSDAAEKKVSAEQALAVRDFLGVDPSEVADIDRYNDIATRALKTLEQVKVKNGEVLNESFAITNKDLSAYTTEEKQRQQDIANADLKAEYADLKAAGLVGAMTEEEYIALQDAINDEELSQAAQARAEEKLDSMRRFVAWKQQFWNDQGAYDSQHTFSPQEQRAIDAIRNADVSKLDLPSLVKVNTVMNNVMENGDTSDLSRTAAIIEGIQNRENTLKLGLRDMKQNLRSAIENFAGNAERLIGAGAKKAAELRRLSGIDEVLDLGVQSQKRADKFAKDTLAKKKELGIAKEDTRTNRARMFVYNLTQQHYGGTQTERQQVFEEHKAMIEEDIRLLQEKKSLTQQEEHILDSATKAYDELLKGSNSAAEVAAKMAQKYPQQKKLADWIVSRYDADLKKKVFDSAKLDNNMNPEEVFNYGPRVWHSLRELPTEREVGQMVLPERMFGRGVDKRPAGSKFSRTGRPKDSILSYDFIKNMQEGYSESDWDASTAHARNVLAEFFRGDQLAKEIGSDAAQWMRRTVVDMLAEQRGLNDATDKDVREVMRGINRLRKIGRGIALKGVAQWVKQPTVLTNTWANLGRDATSTFSFIDMPNGDKLREQFQIAGRKSTNAGYDKLVRRIHGGVAKEDMAKGAEAARHFVSDIGTKILDKGEDLMSVFISTPDVWSANLSWNAFYKQSLKDQGVDIKSRDFSKEWQSPNKQAASYANQQVERLQGSNSAATMARIYRNGGARVLLSQVAPFSSFALNMRMRIIRDTNTLLNGPKEDKYDAAKALAGTMAEQVAFQAVRTAFYIFLTKQLVDAALSALDLGDDEEREKKAAERTPWRDAALLSLSDFVLGGTTQFVQTGGQQAANWAYRYLKPVEAGPDGTPRATKDLFFQYPEREDEWGFVKYMGEAGVAARTVNNIVNKIGEMSDSDLQVTKGGTNFQDLSMSELERQTRAGLSDGPRVQELDESLLTDKEAALATISILIDIAALTGFSEQNVNSVNNAVWKEVKKSLDQKQGKETLLPIMSKPKEEDGAPRTRPLRPERPERPTR